MADAGAGRSSGGVAGVNGIAVGAVAIGALLVWSGLRGAQVTAALRSLLSGQQPITGTEPIATPSTPGSSGGGSGGSGSGGSGSAPPGTPPLINLPAGSPRQPDIGGLFPTVTPTPVGRGGLGGGAP